MKSKATKYAFVSSMISIFLCVVMLIGTTFAWFTDAASTDADTIQSGILDVAVVDDEGEDLEGSTLGWIKADGSQGVLWEPGCTYTVETANIVNNGNLALKYKVAINGIDGDEEILEAIDFTAYVDGVAVDLDEFEGALLPGEGEQSRDTLVIEGHMKRDAGNEYQNLKLEGISIIVKAAQLPHEFDSYNNTYDANAEYGDEADVEEPTEPEEPEKPEEPEASEYKSWLHRVSEKEVDRLDGCLNYGSTVFNKVDAGIITALSAEYISISQSSSTDSVKAILVIEEGATVNKIVFGEYNSFKLPAGGKLVDNLSGNDVKLEISGTLKINGTKITSAEQLSAYLNNISDITFK